MIKRKGTGVEHQPVGLRCAAAAVQRVSQDGMADRGHMDADLVGAAGVEAAFYEKEGAAFYG